MQEAFGMAVVSDRSGSALPGVIVVEAPPETVMSGEVQDDSHLHGVLALIQCLGLRVCGHARGAAKPIGRVL
jgi:hypothetical protein